MSETTRRITFSLDEIDDAEILAWLDGIGSRKRSEAIRIALRAHLDDPDERTERIVNGIVDKLRAMDWNFARSGGISRTPDVDPVVRENLAGLGA